MGAGSGSKDEEFLQLEHLLKNDGGHRDRLKIAVRQGCRCMPTTVPDNARGHPSKCRAFRCGKWLIEQAPLLCQVERVGKIMVVQPTT